MTNTKEVDVLVVGNGPSAISLSFLLSGWTPYYQAKEVPEEDLLRTWLSFQDTKVPLTEMNLRDLSYGLEGRTTNPVALVFDQLCHPYADIGSHIPSQLTWVKQTERAVNHLVVGKERNAGGVWQTMKKELKTLSRSSWMGLPDYPFTQYLQQQSAEAGEFTSYNPGDRACVPDVTRYYEEYVREKGLSQNFLNNCLVTSVEKVPSSPQLVNEDTGEIEGVTADYIWEVTILRLDEELLYDNRSYKDLSYAEKHFCIRAKHVVLATGASDVPNSLGVPGESLDFVKHGVASLEESITRIDNNENNPVLVIGAGLSAADAILSARRHGFSVIHVFRETPCGNPAQMLKRLPKAIYPEYVQMYELMCGDEIQDWYTPYPQYSTHSFLDTNKVILESKEGDTEILEISLALVQIGSSPDLSFMPSQGTNLGHVKGLHIDLKDNLLDVDPFTYESHVEKGLYALGPLVGDNFVRFIKGGAIAIAQDIQKKKGVIGDVD